MTSQSRIRGLVVSMAAILLCPAFSQTSSTSSSSGGTTTTGAKPSSTGTLGTPSTSNTSTLPQIPPLRVSGRVMVDDGTPPDFPASIERVCGGSPHTEGYTDAKGYFSVLLGQNPEVIQDASDTSGIRPMPGTTTSSTGTTGSGSMRGLGSDMRLANCELRARLGGYTSKSIDLSGRSSMDNPEIGTILLHHMGASETATTVTPTTLKAPKEARRALQKGLDLEKKNKTEEALASLQEAVKVDPNFAFAWCELGKLQLQTDHIPDGHESFESAVRAEPNWPEPYLHLAEMGVKAHDWREVRDTTDHVIRLNSYEYPQAYFLNGAANFNLHHIDVAEKSLAAAERLDTEHAFPQIQQLLSLIYADHHQYAQAAKELRSYLLIAPNADDAPSARQQLAILERMEAAAPQTAQKDQQ